MALIPENRMEQILAGENITPESRTEAFAKEAIDNAGSGGGSGSLPTPGTAGNVLTSTGSGWESAAPQGGELVCNFTMDGQGNISCDTRVSAILDAIANNRPIVGSFDEGDRVNYLIVRRTTENTVALQMTDTISTRRITINNLYGTIGDPSDTWSLDPTQYQTLFSVDSDDNGKVLGVDNGAYALVDSKAPVEFGFDIAVDTSGGSPVFTATARTGSTYANITAAMAVNPNVLMKAYLPDNEVLIAPFNRKRNTLVSASGLVPDYSGTTLTNWQAFGLNVEDSDTLVVFFNNLTLQ